MPFFSLLWHFVSIKIKGWMEVWLAHTHSNGLLFNIRSLVFLLWNRQSTSGERKKMNNSGQICQVTTLLGIVGPTCKSSYTGAKVMFSHGWFKLTCEIIPVLYLYENEDIFLGMILVLCMKVGIWVYLIWTWRLVNFLSTCVNPEIMWECCRTLLFLGNGIFYMGTCCDYLFLIEKSGREISILMSLVIWWCPKLRTRSLHSYCKTCALSPYGQYGRSMQSSVSFFLSLEHRMALWPGAGLVRYTSLV